MNFTQKDELSSCSKDKDKGQKNVSSGAARVVVIPAAGVKGVPWEEASRAGSFIGQKIILNEFVAYKALLDDGSLSPISEGIVTFALCGFANLSSIAILLGGLGGMAPSRRPDIARMGLKAVFAASLANFMSAAIAGIFLTLGS